MPMLPLFESENTAGVLVPKASVVVPMYKFPPMEEKSQCLRLVPAEASDRANDGRVPAIWKFQFGVVVPIPTFLFESTTRPLPPTVRSEEKRLVDEAVVEKKLVEVAFVVVELPEIFKFPVKVEDALGNIMLEVVAETPAVG